MARQTTFAHDRARRRAERKGARVAGPGSRAAARREAHELARRAASPLKDGPRARALAMVERELLAVITKWGKGRRFHAIDFTNHLHEIGMDPPRDVLDLRAMGGMFRRLEHRGVLAHAGYQSTPKGSHTRTHSTVRTVWKVARLPRDEDASLRASRSEAA